MIVLTTPEPTVRPPSREFLPVLSSVFDVFSGFLYTENMNFLCIIYIIQSSWHRFGTAKKQVFPKHCCTFIIYLVTHLSSALQLYYPN